MSATLPVSLGRATPPSSEWTRCWTRKAWFRKSGIMKVTLATCLSLTPTFVRCREPTSAGRWPTFQGPPFQGSLDEAACWSSSRADPALRQRVDRAGMNLTPPTSPKPAETSESIALILFKSCRIVGCRFQEEDTHIQKDGKKRHWDTLRFVESHLKKPSPLLKKWQVTVTKLHVFFWISHLGSLRMQFLGETCHWFSGGQAELCSGGRGAPPSGPGFWFRIRSVRSDWTPKAVTPGRLLLYIAIRMMRCLLRSGKLGMI